MSNDIAPFRIAATDTELEDLKRRLNATRWPERECVDDWSQGLPLGYAKEVCTYWLEKYNWREREARLNRFAQFKTPIDGIKPGSMDRDLEERYCGGVCLAIARLNIRQMMGPSRFATATPEPMMRREKTSITTMIQ